jgi:hypothetical protein
MIGRVLNDEESIPVGSDIVGMHFMQVELERSPLTIRSSSHREKLRKGAAPQQWGSADKDQTVDDEARVDGDDHSTLSSVVGDRQSIAEKDLPVWIRESVERISGRSRSFVEKQESAVGWSTENDAVMANSE